MALIVGRRPPLVTRKRIVWDARIVTEGTTAPVIRVGPSQGVICVHREMMSHSLAEADVHPVIVRTPDRFFVTNARELRLARHRFKKSIQRGCAASSTHGYALIDVDGLVLVQTQHVRVFCLENGVLIQRPAVAKVKLLGYRVAIVRIHQTAHTALRELGGRRRNCWKRADAVSPLTKGQAGAGNRVSRARKAEHRLKDRCVAHLFHEQRNVLEYVPKVEAISPAQYMLTSASQIVSEADPRAEVLVVVVRYAADERIRDWAVKRNQCLIRAAILDVRP